MGAGERAFVSKKQTLLGPVPRAWGRCGPLPEGSEGICEGKQITRGGEPSGRWLGSQVCQSMRRRAGQGRQGQTCGEQGPWPVRHQTGPRPPATITRATAPHGLCQAGGGCADGRRHGLTGGLGLWDSGPQCPHLRNGDNSFIT